MKARLPFNLLVLFAILTFPTFNLQAQTGVTISDQRVDYLFGHHVAFEAQIESELTIESVEIYFKQVDSDNTSIIHAEIDAGSRVLGVYEFSAGTPLKAFAQVNYWFRVLFETEQPLESEIFSFEYSDNRFDWQVDTTAPFNVYSYHTDSAFSQDILAAAARSLKISKDLLGLETSDSIDIYAYKQSEDLKYALNLSGRSWLAGHANPTLGVALVSIRPGDQQDLEIGRQVPHEVSHLLLYQANPAAYELLPLWLNEGYASVSEQNTIDEYQLLVKSAAESEGLIPLLELCDNFPSSASQAKLAYAQSASFVSFLLNEFGTNAIAQLIDEFAKDQSCEDGPEGAFGSPLLELEEKWKLTVSPPSEPENSAEDNLPWLIIVMFSLVVFLSQIFSNNRKRKIRKQLIKDHVRK